MDSIESLPFAKGAFVRKIGLLLLVCFGLAVSTAHAELKPEEVGVLASNKGRESNELALYYMKARGIPAENLFVVDAPTGEIVTRASWDLKIRPSIRKWLIERNKKQTIRCLVTLWDLPLKISGVDQGSGRPAEVKAFLEQSKAKGRADILELANSLNRLLDTEAKRLDPPPESADTAMLAKHLDAPFQRAMARVQKLASVDPEVPSTLLVRQRIERLYGSGSGLVGGLRFLEAQLQAPKPSLELRHAVELRKGELNGLRTGLTHLAFLPESVDRDSETLATFYQTDGLLGAHNWAGQQHDLWAKNETYSSFESELALVLWSDHALLRWLPNLNHHSQPRVPSTRQPTLMVSRLDGPTFEIAKRLVDDAVEIEKAGLTGKVYIDARGLPASKDPGAYGEYDQSLRDLAILLRKKTRLDVILDDKNPLFQPGDCPDAALYCGWYSLANYVDAFKWRKGSVAYHIASGEMTTLRNAKSNVWCKRMLEEGVAATLGPTHEPYLAAFPKPAEFFPLLLTGKLTLAEVYAATCPFQSWVITMVGDPLYNPYKNSPQMSAEDLPLQLQHVLVDP